MSGRSSENIAEALANIVALLMAGDASRADLVKISGMSLNYVTNLINIWRARKLVHCSSIGEDSRGRLLVERFKLGEGEDVKRKGAKVDTKARRRSAAGRKLQKILAGSAPPRQRRKPLAVIPEAIREVATSE